MVMRFFVSSTFRDMNEERETLHAVVIPEVREYARQKGVYVDIEDLRWGIKNDKEREKTRDKEARLASIMDICFRELDRCRPYIIAIVGSYYGTVPEDSSYAEEWWKNNGVGKHIPKDTKISLTQWELEYSFLYSDTRIICLFRTSTDEFTDCDREKMSKLKARILKTGQSKCSVEKLCYSDMKEFSERLSSAIKSEVDIATSQAPAHWAETERLNAHTYAENKVGAFQGRKSLIKKILCKISDKETKVIRIYGSSGIGKSTLVSYIYKSLQSDEYHDTEATLILCGQGIYNGSYFYVLMQIIYSLESDGYAVKDGHSEITGLEQAEKYLAHLLNDTSNDKKHVIIVDALDKISTHRAENLVHLFEQSSNSSIKLICTRIEPFGEITATHTADYEIGNLNESDIADILEKQLYCESEAKHKMNKDDLIQSIMLKKGSISPLYLRMVISVLKMHISGKTDEYIDIIKHLPDDEETLSWTVLVEAVRFLRKREVLDIDESCLLFVSGLLSVSEHGILAEDFERMPGGMDWGRTGFTVLRNYLDYYFRQRDDGAWVYEHDLIRSGIRRNCVFYSNLKRVTSDDLSVMLYDHLKSPDATDSLRIKEGIRLAIMYDDIDLGIDILKTIADISDRRMKAVAANMLNDNISSKEGTTWFGEVIRNSRNVVIAAVSNLLKLEGAEDYERRIPAKMICQMFWKLEGLTTQNAVADYASEMSLEEQFAFASMCVEYVSVCESTGSLMDSVIYEFFPYRFFNDNKKVDQLDNTQKEEAYRHANSLLFSNNKALNQIKGVSKDIIKEHKKNIFDTGTDHDALITAMYDSNTGQYYNAMEQYEKAIEYHFRSLYEKGLLLIQKAKLTDDFQKDFEVSFGTTGELDATQIQDVLFKKHRDFWDGFSEAIQNQCDTQKRETLAMSWALVANSYGTIGNDCYHLAEEPYISLGTTCLSISAAMLRNPVFYSSNRWYLMTLIRKIGIYALKQNLEADELKMLNDDIMKACKLYSYYRDYIGDREGENLNKNLKDLMDNASVPSDHEIKMTIEDNRRDLPGKQGEN